MAGEIGQHIEFGALSCIDREVGPWRGRRRCGKIYGAFRITGGGPGDWFGKFKGLEFFAEIQFCKNGQGRRKVARVIPVRLTGRDAVRGQPIPGEAVTMI